MGYEGLTQSLLTLFGEAGSHDDLGDALAEATAALGFRHFALTHHIDRGTAGAVGLRLHNYPENWEAIYDDHGFGGTDPVHRASQTTHVGFAWSRIPGMIGLSPADRELLALGRAHGIADGFTVPAHIPGEARGSVSFVAPVSGDIDDRALLIAQIVGSFAFETARKLHAGQVGAAALAKPVLTDRQRECLYWVARGKTDWEIARILACSEETVGLHIRQACRRYGVSKRTLVVIRALWDGTLTFPEFPCLGYTPFPV